MYTISEPFHHSAYITSNHCQERFEFDVVQKRIKKNKKNARAQICKKLLNCYLGNGFNFSDEKMFQLKESQKNLL
jgi:hypothetical protein